MSEGEAHHHVLKEPENGINGSYYHYFDLVHCQHEPYHGVCLFEPQLFLTTDVLFQDVFRSVSS